MRKPIKFNPLMLSAILDNRKTETRRPSLGKYQVGDLLYVQEPWQIIGWNEDMEFWIKYLSDDKNGLLEIPCEENENGELEQIFYSESIADIEKAGYGLNEETGNYEYPHDDCPTRIRPAKTMPEWASRIFLEVANIKTEYLHDITEEGAKREGVKPSCVDEFGHIHSTACYRFGFSTLWNAIYFNNKERCWSANPKVDVLTLKRITL